jgi:putative toxin-antitoxin system antitoxin component (TIGR02293 family)
MRPQSRIEPAPRGAHDRGLSLYERVANLLGLKSHVRSEVELIERLEKGLPVGAVHALRSRAGLTDEEAYALIAPRRTLQRRETLRQSLSPEEADRAVRIARITARAQYVFDARPDYAFEWLRTPHPAIGGRTAMQALASESGALAVEDILIGIEYGMFG